MLHLLVSGHEVGIFVPASPSKRNQPGTSPLSLFLDCAPGVKTVPLSLFRDCVTKDVFLSASVRDV